MLSRTDQQRIDQAIRIAGKSKHHKIKVGALLSVAGRVSSSPNIPRNDARICWEHASIHAEQAALSSAYKEGEGGTIYVARVGKSGRVLPSFPCQRCVPILKRARVKRIVWFDGQRWTDSRL